jgi:uncharacterized protein
MKNTQNKIRSETMSDYHESVELLDEKTRDYTRALNSLKEEVEAVDWYNQRLGASKNSELKAILEHNMKEEMEHAAMTLEWLRRNMPGWDEELRHYLFTTKPITEIEDSPTTGPINLGIGKLK